MRRLREILMKQESPTILDIGTGTGQFVKLMSDACQQYAKIVGIDTQKRAVEQAKTYFDDERISFIHGNVYDCKETFDIVCLSNSLHHFDEPAVIMNKMLALVKEGGLTIINEMIKDGQTDKQMTHVGLHHFWAQIDRLLDVPHHETFDKMEILNHVYVKGSKLMDAWEFEFEETQTFTPDDYTMLKNSVHKSLKRVEDHEMYDDLVKTGQILEKRIEEVGFELATEFMVVLKKS